jgi:hypothetical protein
MYLFSISLLAGMFLLCVILQGVHAQQADERTPALSTLRVKDELLDQYFKDGINIHFDQTISTIINQPIEDERFQEAGVYPWMRLITTKIDAQQDIWYTIDFSAGGSLDPMFIIYRNEHQELKELGNILGLEITFPGDGFFYVTGHTNNTFNQRRKFTIRDDTLIEIQQPFYYVGLETLTKEDLDVYADFELTTCVAHLPKNTPITVLLNTEDYYLIKTPRDILGWAKIHVGQQDTMIEGLYYFGD